MLPAPSAAAVESSRALERRFAELAEERGVLAAALEEVQGRAAQLEYELTHLTGQQNLNQRIQYHKKVRQEGCRAAARRAGNAPLAAARHACAGN